MCEWKNTNLESGKNYFIKATITFRAADYSSGSSLDVTKEKERYAEQVATQAKIAASQAATAAAITASKTATAAAITASQAELTTAVSAVQAVLKTDIAAVGTKAAQILTATGTQTSSISAIAVDVESVMKSAILNRETAVKLGDELTIRYRT